jgi:hypothetical protein
MLRVQQSVDGETVRFMLSGRIEAEHVAELERLIEGEGPRHTLTFDLKEVHLVDGEAVRFLAGCEARGVTLENCCAYVREWIDREGKTTRSRRATRGSKRRSRR